MSSCTSRSISAWSNANGGECVDGEPACLSRVVGRGDGWSFIEIRRKGDGDNALAWVAVGASVGADLHQLACRDASLLSELTPCGGWRVLVDFHKSAGESPMSLKRLILALHQQHVHFATFGRECDAVGSDCRMWIVVSVFLHIFLCGGLSFVPIDFVRGIGGRTVEHHSRKWANRVRHFATLVHFVVENDGVAVL